METKLDKEESPPPCLLLLALADLLSLTFQLCLGMESQSDLDEQFVLSKVNISLSCVTQKLYNISLNVKIK